VAFGLAPLDQDSSRRLLGTLRGGALLTGARGAASVDVDAIARTVRAVGDLVSSVPEIAELDLNPVLATATGAVAVDWRIRARNSPGQDEEKAVD
ncbi:MAG TPA: acetate--CoA ligase family protein, partial [Gemmatimonadales bacterium]|nr:acetate--CoA ligase family protein [Gemmatimonadales bacterium]